MTARNVSVFLTNWHATAQQPKVQQYTVDCELQWVDYDNSPHAWIGVLTFPNDLQDVDLATLKEWATDLIVRIARRRLGIDPNT